MFLSAKVLNESTQVRLTSVMPANCFEWYVTLISGNNQIAYYLIAFHLVSSSLLSAEVAMKLLLEHL